MEASTRLHPLLSAAAISVIVLSVAGVGALTGLLPRSAANLESPQMPAAAPVPTPTAPVIAPAPEPKPVKKTVVRASAPAAPKKATAVYEARPLPSDEDFLRAERAPLPPAAVAAPRCTNCGTVENVRVLEQKGDGSGIGAVAGGVAGAVVGKQFGKGSGRTIMTILGAAGGAYAGHEAEKHIRAKKHWEVSVRLDDGSSRLLTYEAEPAWRSGDRVRYVNGALEPERA